MVVLYKFPVDPTISNFISGTPSAPSTVCPTTNMLLYVSKGDSRLFDTYRWVTARSKRSWKLFGGALRNLRARRSEACSPVSLPFELLAFLLWLTFSGSSRAFVGSELAAELVLVPLRELFAGVGIDSFLTARFLFETAVDEPLEAIVRDAAVRPMMSRCCDRIEARGC
jgi:hypothetical protein